MAKRSKDAANGKTSVKKPHSRSRSLAEQGIFDDKAFAKVMSALMTDLLTGAISPQVANAVCNSGGKLLKVVEMRSKRPAGAGPLQLTAK